MEGILHHPAPCPVPMCCWSPALGATVTALNELETPVWLLRATLTPDSSKLCWGMASWEHMIHSCVAIPPDLLGAHIPIRMTVIYKVKQEEKT